MWPFAQKLNPFCSFSINQGPMYIERIFDSWLSLEGVSNVVRMQDIERYELYIDLLKRKIPRSNRQVYAFIQFFLGHFYQQLSLVSPKRVNAQHYKEKALCYYQSYSAIATSKDESIYYAQWQTGLLQDALNYPWNQTEYALLKANDLDRLRGEALKKIVDHFIQVQNWPTAYCYSKELLNRFFERNPAAYRKWSIEFDAYNWTLLEKHFNLCRQMRYSHEANYIQTQLQYYRVSNPDTFSNKEMRQIYLISTMAITQQITIWPNLKPT